MGANWHRTVSELSGRKLYLITSLLFSLPFGQSGNMKLI